MNTPDTEKKLVKLVEYKIKDTLLNLIYDLAENPVSKAEYIVPKSILDIKEQIEKAYCSIGDLLEETDRTAYEDNLNSIMKSIISSAININRYISANDQLGEKLLRAFKLNDIKNIDSAIPLNNSGITSTVKGYLSTLSDDFESKFKMAELISAFPLRMTREKYADYVKKGTELLIKDLPDEFAVSCIDRLKDMFYSDCKDSFSNDFPLMYEKLESVSESINDLNKEDITEALNDIDGNVDSIQGIYGLLGVYFNDVIYLQIISMFAVDSEFLFNNDMVLKDLYYSLNDVITSKDTSFLEDILERTENEISERFDISKPIEEEISAKISKMTDEDYNSLSVDTKTALNVNNTISEMFFSELDQHIMLSITSNKDRETSISELIEYINHKTETMSNQDKKLLKQNFLKNIPCPMTKEELGNYCGYSLDGINDKAVSLMTYGNIFQITDEAMKEMQEHHHHHSHSHNCSCGHEHHNHNCNCEHEHHHEHNHNCNCEHEHHHEHNHNCNHDH